MLMEMAGSRSCEGRAFQDNGPDEQKARGPNVEVDVRGTNSLCWSAERKYVRSVTAESGVQNLVRPCRQVVKQSLNVTRWG